MKVLRRLILSATGPVIVLIGCASGSPPSPVFDLSPWNALDITQLGLTGLEFEALKDEERLEGIGGEGVLLIRYIFTEGERDRSKMRLEAIQFDPGTEDWRGVPEGPIGLWMSHDLSPTGCFRYATTDARGRLAVWRLGEDSVWLIERDDGRAGLRVGRPPTQAFRSGSVRESIDCDWIRSPSVLEATPKEPPDTTRVLVRSTSRAWSRGERGALPVRARFFRSSTASLLDSATVRQAIQSAMLAVGIAPDLEFGSFAAQREEPPFVRVEVDAYGAGEVRISVALIEEGRAWRPACGGGSTGKEHDTVSAALQVTHRVRDALECSMRKLSLH